MVADVLRTELLTTFWCRLFTNLTI